MTLASQVMVTSYVNKEIMHTHLKQISTSTVKDRHAIIIVNGATWYTENIITDINNVRVIELLPYFP